MIYCTFKEEFANYDVPIGLDYVGILHAKTNCGDNALGKLPNVFRKLTNKTNESIVHIFEPLCELSEASRAGRMLQKALKDPNITRAQTIKFRMIGNFAVSFIHAYPDKALPILNRMETYFDKFYTVISMWTFCFAYPKYLSLLATSPSSEANKTRILQKSKKLGRKIIGVLRKFAPVLVSYH